MPDCVKICQFCFDEVVEEQADPSPLNLACSLDPITTLDDICFEADGSRSIVQLEEQAASVAQNRARVIATPQRCCAGFAVLADWL